MLWKHIWFIAEKVTQRFYLSSNFKSTSIHNMIDGKLDLIWLCTHDPRKRYYICTLNFAKSESNSVCVCVCVCACVRACMRVCACVSSMFWGYLGPLIRLYPFQTEKNTFSTSTNAIFNITYTHFFTLLITKKPPKNGYTRKQPPHFPMKP